MAASQNISVLIVTMNRIQGDHASPVPPEEQDAGLTVLGKAYEIFQICDLEGTGFITCQGMQRLHCHLPPSLEELEKVFVTLDADGNSLLTLKEFTAGLSDQFLMEQITLNKEMMQQSEGETVCQLKCKESMSDDEDEFQFSNLMNLGAKKVFDDENDVKQLWLQLRKGESHLLSSFEEFLVRIFSQLQEADNEKNKLECALEKQKSYKSGLTHQRNEKFEMLKQQQSADTNANLEQQCTELLSSKEEIKVENIKLKQTNQELQLSESHKLSQAQKQQVLQEEASRPYEEKEMEVHRVTETLQRQKSGLLKQLDFLRAAYWAEGLNLLERGDTLTITGTVDQRVESVQKAACVRMMYDWGLRLKQESPMMTLVDPKCMTPLIQCLLDSLKPAGNQLQGKIQSKSQSEKAVAAPEGLLSPDQKTEKKVWTWGEVAQELINYGRKYGPINISSKIDTKGWRRTEDYSLIFCERSAYSGYNTKKSVLHLARILKEYEGKVKEKTTELQADMNKKSCCIRP
ncbi:LOW QUALITY PROTEIN: EF-hand calcium-binding domain-containing protein 4B [Amazona ochrocephala]